MQWKVEFSTNRCLLNFRHEMADGGEKGSRLQADVVDHPPTCNVHSPSVQANNARSLPRSCGRWGAALRAILANIAFDDALILPHRANPTGLNFRKRQPYCLSPLSTN